MPWQPGLDALRDALADIYDAEADVRRVVDNAGLSAARLPLARGQRSECVAKG